MARPAKRPSEHLSPSGTLRVGVVSKANSWTELTPFPSLKSSPSSSVAQEVHKEFTTSLWKFHLWPDIRGFYQKQSTLTWGKSLRRSSQKDWNQCLATLPHSYQPGWGEAPHHCQKLYNMPGKWWRHGTGGGFLFFHIHLASKQWKYWVGLIFCQLTALI